MALPPLTFTLDLEDHREGKSGPARYGDNTRRLLDFFDELQCRATVFVVGDIATTNPDLVTETASRGHELAFHSQYHRQLEFETPKRFLAETRDGKARLEDLSGKPVIGFRAPVYSLTSLTSWAVDTLAETGFEYSSSVMPARNPLHVFHDAPQEPFVWPQGVLELPVPVTNVFGASIAFAGGFYLRYLPWRTIVRAIDDYPEQGCLWSCVHPYDIDDREPFTRIAGAPLWVSTLLWLNRRNTLKKLRTLHALVSTAAPFAERIAAGEFATASVWGGAQSSVCDPGCRDEPGMAPAE